MIKSVNIIGSGNVASYLYASLRGKVEVVSVFSRDNEHAKDLIGNDSVQICLDLESLPEADLSIIAVSDDAIASVVPLMDKNLNVVHTSGSVDMSVFGEFQKAGILYPLQSFTNGYQPENLDFPYLIEGSDSNFEKEIVTFCTTNLSERAVIVDSQKRAKIHLAAVLVNNFTNHLAYESEQILSSMNEDLSLLKPLMLEGIAKIFNTNSYEAQTGPARRKDEKVIQQQLDSLENEDLQALYKLFTKMIQDRFNT